VAVKVKLKFISSEAAMIVPEKMDRIHRLTAVSISD
jgi:hypothetical protein